TAGALETLVRYDWPGNVRELQNVIHRAVVLAREPVLQMHDIPLDLALPETGVGLTEDTGLPLREACDQFERQYVLRVLERVRRISPEEMAVAYQLGLAYFSLNRYDEAQVVLEHVFRRDPGLDSLGYYVGYLRYRKGDHQGALQAFRAGRTTDPNIAQLTRFYTGLALNAMGMSRQAAAEVEQALRLQPASPLAGPAERLRQSFAESRDAERRLHASLRLGGFFDDNVNARPSAHPSSDTVNALRRPENQSRGALASLRLEYAWLQ